MCLAARKAERSQLPNTCWVAIMTPTLRTLTSVRISTGPRTASIYAMYPSSRYDGIPKEAGDQHVHPFLGRRPAHGFCPMVEVILGCVRRSSELGDENRDREIDRLEQRLGDEEHREPCQRPLTHLWAGVCFSSRGGTCPPDSLPQDNAGQTRISDGGPRHAAFLGPWHREVVLATV